MRKPIHLTLMPALAFVSLQALAIGPPKIEDEQLLRTTPMPTEVIACTVVNWGKEPIVLDLWESYFDPQLGLLETTPNQYSLDPGEHTTSYFRTNGYSAYCSASWFGLRNGVRMTGCAQDEFGPINPLVYKSCIEGW